jgi:glycosyltransferase involved in cell wall biosynthesis
VATRVLVTRAGGFIGHHLTKYLVNKGYLVWGVDIKRPEYEPNPAHEVQSKPGGSKVVAFCGTRGLPAKYSGFETAVDEISRRFVEWGYSCVVFGRESSGDKALKHHKGRRLVYVRGSSVRTLDTFVAAFQTGWHLLLHRRQYDYVFWFNNANLPGILLTLLARIPLSVNLDGLEWRRAKWSWPFKAYYFFASFLISRLCKSLISDSEAIRAYYKKNFLKYTEGIPYGASVRHSASSRRQHILHQYGVVPGRYFLQITRFEPENLPLDAAKAFQHAGLVKDGFKLLLIGYQHETPYAQQIKALSGRNGIIVADAVFDAETLDVLRKNCFCYIHGNSVGGTNPALLEAMASCPRVLAIEGPFSREVLANTGYFFTPKTLTASLRSVLSYPDQSEAMQERIQSRYQWEAVARSYMRLVEGRPAAYYRK